MYTPPKILFFKTIANETPEVIEDLFERNDVALWANKWKIKDDWIIAHAKNALSLVPEEKRSAQRSRFAWNKPLIDSERESKSRSDTLSVIKSTLKKLGGDDSHIEDTPKDTFNNKRNAKSHCRWLVLWWFKDMTDQEIADIGNAENAQTIGDGRRAFAKLIGANPPIRRGKHGKPRLTLKMK